MARKRKKSPHNKKNAAGNSRISVLSEEKDTYNPFKDIKKMDVIETVEKKEEENKLKDNRDKNKNKKIIDIDTNKSFEEIFNQWENVGSSNKNKDKDKKDASKDKQSEDFASIFNQWERSQGLKPKQDKKVKDSPSRKNSEYKPTKDFSQILDDFENGSSKKKTSSNIKKEAKKVNNNLKKDEDKNSFKAKVKKEDKIKAASLEDKNSSKSNVKTDKAEKKKEDKIKEASLENKNSSKSKVKNDSSSKQNFSKKKKEYVDKNKSIKKQKDSFSKNSDSLKNKSDNNPKWDFSNIYGTWESTHDDSKYIEEKKKAEKKENKGISISYLRSMSPQDEIDLHGLTSDIAALKVSEFLVVSRNRGLKKVSIITGKGIHSEKGKSVIKDVVLDEIRYSNIVREAYHPKAVYGGSGVIWVIFKSTNDKKVYFN